MAIELAERQPSPEPEPGVREERVLVLRLEEGSGEDIRLTVGLPPTEEADLHLQIRSQTRIISEEGRPVIDRVLEIDPVLTVIVVLADLSKTNTLPGEGSPRVPGRPSPDTSISVTTPVTDRLEVLIMGRERVRSLREAMVMEGVKDEGLDISSRLILPSPWPLKLKTIEDELKTASEAVDIETLPKPVTPVREAAVTARLRELQGDIPIPSTGCYFRFP